jgi:4-hydroxybenzoate polyprenyltransferase
LGISTALAVCFSSTLYGITISPALLLATFLSTIAVYSLNKVTDTAEDSINKPEQTSNRQTYYLILSISSFIISIAIGIIQGWAVFLVLLTPLFIGVIYSIKISKSLPRLKEILGVKSLLVAFSWAFTGSLLPALTSRVAPEKIVLVFIYILIHTFVGTVLFDTLDIRGDDASNVKTIPIQLGKYGTRHLLLIVNSMLLLWLGFCIASGLFISYLPAAMFGMLYSYALIWYFTKTEGKRLHAELFIDGEWLPFIVVLQLLIH